jgi:class 3 adenylate cyclase
MTLNLEKSKLGILDLNSSNGIFFRGKKITELLLTPGQSITAGNLVILFTCEETKPHDGSDADRIIKNPSGLSSPEVSEKNIISKSPRTPELFDEIASSTSKLPDTPAFLGSPSVSGTDADTAPDSGVNSKSDDIFSENNYEAEKFFIKDFIKETQNNNIPEKKILTPDTSYKKTAPDCRNLLNISRYIFSIKNSSDLAAYLSGLVSHLKKSLSILILIDEKTKKLYDPISMSPDFDTLVKISCAKTIKSLSPMLITSTDSIPPKYLKSRLAPGSIMCIPLIFQNRILGALYSETTAKSPVFNKKELDFMTMVLELAAMLLNSLDLEKTVLNERAQKKAMERYISPDIVNDILGNRGNDALGGKKTYATIVFSDIRGFTKMSENMSAENVVRLLNHYFSSMTDIIFEHSGTLDKFIGDEIMALFGVPVETQKHAENALFTAMHMIKKTKEMRTFLLRNMLPVFEIGIGVNSGEVVAGNIGSAKRMEFTVIGDTVNTASRLVSAAKPGEIIINESTYELTKNSFKFKILPPIEVKGKSKKLNIFKLIDVK